MRNRMTVYRHRFLAKAVGAASLAGLAAACSADATRVREPFFTGATANQRQMMAANQPMPAPVAPTTAVARSDLPPATGGTYSAVGAQTVIVGPGESLDTLALKYGVPSVDIARANGISNPSQLQPGNSIVIPRRTDVAYAAPAQPAPASVPSSGGVVHIVEPGQTLFSISQAQGVSLRDLAALNGIGPDAAIRVGQRLKIPASGAPAVQTAALSPQNQSVGAQPKPLGTATAGGSQASPPSTEAAPVAAAPTKPVTTAAANPAAAVDAAEPPSADGTSFRWPVRGRIISSYGSKSNGERNDGINLAVPEGTSVKAAEAGTVIYAGNELAGYGNLVLIRHADGWVSAYAHTSEINVKRGDTVQRGQIIGQAGATGSVSSPQVHFELRKGAKPVNPLDYLAGA